MKNFRFRNKPQTKAYTIYTLIAVVLSILIFSGLDIHISKQMAYLLATTLSFISILSAVKKAGKEFEEIIFQQDDIKFYFYNKMKDPLVIPKTKVSALILDGNAIELTNNETQKVIGQAFKNKLENTEDWEDLIKCLDLENEANL